MRLSDSSCHIHLLCSDVIPKRLACLIQGIISCQSCHICHTRVEINGANSMTHRCFLISHWQMCLIILIANLCLLFLFCNLALTVKVIRLRTSLVDKIFSQLFIFFITCNLIQTDKCHLCNLMTRIALTFAFFCSKI